MTNICLITSIINIPNLPFSYTNTRSIYTTEERFEQTKDTINSIKKYIPNVKIIFVECSDLNKEFQTYIIERVDHFLNFYQDIEIRNKVFSKSKSLGEGTLTIKGLEFIFNKKIEFKNFFKISARFYLNNKFDYYQFDNNYINYMINNTRFYKINYNYLAEFYNFLISKQTQHKFYCCEGYENIFSIFIKEQINNTMEIKFIGLEGYISVSYCKIDE